MKLDGAALQRRLADVFWIGGPPDCGKTSIADLLAGRHGWQAYHFDRHEMDHIRRADPQRHPALVALRRTLGELDERAFAEMLWVARPPDEMARAAIASWSERCELAVEDLLNMPPEPPIVAEGPGFFPERIALLLADRHQAVWLVPSEEFKRASVSRRGKPSARRLTSNPDRATRNLIERDMIMGRHVAQRALDLGLALVTVDGSESLEEVAARRSALWPTAHGDRRGGLSEG